MLGGLCGSGNTMRPLWIVALATPGTPSPDATASVTMLTTQTRNWIPCSVELLRTAAGYQCLQRV